MIDVAMCLDRLTPDAIYEGVLTQDHIEREHDGVPMVAYKALGWGDDRPKPSWVEIETIWPEVEAEIVAESTHGTPPTVRELYAAIDAKDNGDLRLWDALRPRMVTGTANRTED